MAEYVPNDGMRSVDVSELACSGIDPKKAISCSIPIGMFGRGFRVTKKKLKREKKEFSTWE